MMVERHYDDETLLTLTEGARTATDAHLTSCPACTEKLDTFRTITDVLHEHDVWDKAPVRAEPVPATIANLRAFADRMTFEDAAADAILPQLLAGPREEWMPRLMAHPEWRTAGVVRRLVARAAATTLSSPLDGFALAILSTETADHLDPSTVRADTIARLRGTAWRERAFALFYLGRYSDALAAAEVADAALSQCVVDEYERARVDLIRSLALRPKEEFTSATAAARSSADAYERFADGVRGAAARLAEMQVLFSRGDFEGAIKILEPLEHRLRTSSDVQMHARVLNNLGACLWKVGRLDEALRHHETAAMLFDALEAHPESARSRWNVALILSLAGRLDEARTRFEELWKTFADLGMTSEATLVSLDLAEMLLARDDFQQVERICHTAMRSLEVAGLSYTSRALTALAYMREATHRRTVTPNVVKHVRDYLRRLPQNGELLFAPPPP